MNLQAAAIIIAGALIAGAIALTNRWEMVYFNAGRQGAKAIHSALLMNRWTGIITICAPTMMTGEFSNWEMSCPPVSRDAQLPKQ